jgi:hypothetical protein
MFRVTLALLCISVAVPSCNSRKQETAKASAASPAKPAPKPPVVQARRHWEVTVAAGRRNQDAQVVIVNLEQNPPPRGVQVREANGASVTAQVAPGILAFRMNPLKAGEQARYLVDEDPTPAKPDAAGMRATQDGLGIKLALGGRPLLNYVNRPDEPKGTPMAASRGGYLHPLYTPAGVLLTDDFPKNKPYQHGIWTAWQKLENQGSRPDFYDLGKGKGRVAVESIGTVWDGPLAAGFDARQYFTDFDKRKGLTALRESWDVSAYRGADTYAIVDLRSAQQAVNGPVTFEPNAIGGILVRGNRDWQSNAIVMTSEGRDRRNAKGTTARWCYLGGKSGGKQAGIAILSHPSNPRAPEAVFIDPTDPLMGFAPAAKQPLSLAARAALSLHYRYVLLDGAPDRKLLDKLWDEFAAPPETQIRLLSQ